MTKLRMILLISAALWMAGCTGSARQPEAAAARPAPSSATPVVLSCPGRVEGASETVEVGANMDGVIRTILVQEGQTVRKGARIAELHCPELPAQLAHAQSEVERARQARVRIARGSRDEERLASEQRVVAAKATLHEAKIHLERMQNLVGSGALARNLLDKAVRDHDVAVARLNEARKNEELVKAAALPEDLAKADAEIASAEQRVDEVKRRIQRCSVGAPIDGTILRVLLKPGESFSTITPRPILTIADLSRLRVRAEVDEQDVSKVSIGQRATVLLDGKEYTTYAGKVTSLSSVMGRKKIRTGDPSEKADRDVLEAVIDLDTQPTLPVGLRVAVRFEPATGTLSQFTGSPK